jgi:hypothetical protein
MSKISYLRVCRRDLKSEAFARAGSSPAVLTILLVSSLLAGCAGSPPPQIASFGDFVPPDTPHYLACPQNYCLTPPDETTSLLPIGAEKLRDIVRRAIEAQPWAELVASENEGLRLVFRRTEQEDTSIVTIDIADADDGASGIAIYSQSLAADRSADRAIVRRLIDTITRDVASAAGDR